MRLITIDFLRGIAVLLVITRHLLFKPYILTIGWIGVDLFFVLSGFLVSNLLFQEYNTTKNIKPIRFLIRRGLKIYPLFYLMIGLFFIYVVYNEPQSISHYTSNLITEILFIQNYNYGKVLLTHTWSLAVEEHFYLTLTLVFFLFARLKILDKKILFNLLTICIMLFCMYMRYTLAYTPPHLPDFAYYLFPTHLRFDTLWLGTFIAFHYNYSPTIFKSIFTGRKWLLLGLAAFIIPIVFPIETPFLAVFGLTFIALSFGITLATLLADDRHEAFLKAFFGKKMLFILAKIGTYSYAIYLFHAMIIVIVKPFTPHLWTRFLNTSLVFLITIVVGIVATELIEKPILRWRNKYVK